MSVIRISRPATLLAVILGLGACTMAPIARPLPVVPAPGGSATGTAPATGMAGAEAACMAAGRERGLDVLGVVSARDVTGPEGAQQRDVMLRVSRSGTQLEVRCNYQPVSGLARIMLI